jgi:hypothetical protein
VANLFDRVFSRKHSEGNVRWCIHRHRAWSWLHFLRQTGPEAGRFAFRSHGDSIPEERNFRLNPKTSRAPCLKSRSGERSKPRSSGGSLRECPDCRCRPQPPRSGPLADPPREPRPGRAHCEIPDHRSASITIGIRDRRSFEACGFLGDSFRELGSRKQSCKWNFLSVRIRVVRVLQIGNSIWIRGEPPRGVMGPGHEIPGTFSAFKHGSPLRPSEPRPIMAFRRIEGCDRRLYPLMQWK